MGRGKQVRRGGCRMWQALARGPRKAEACKVLPEQARPQRRVLFSCKSAPVADPSIQTSAFEKGPE